MLRSFICEIQEGMKLFDSNRKQISDPRALWGWARNSPRVICQKKHLLKEMLLFHEIIMLKDEGKAFQKYLLVPGY